MMFRKKPVEIEASQWWKDGDHPAVSPCPLFEDPCPKCGNPGKNHGGIMTLEGTHIVCPGDWIITGVKGENYACKPDIFDLTYEKVEE